MARLLFIRRESNQMWKITEGLVAQPFNLREEAHRLNLVKVANSPKALDMDEFVCHGHRCPAGSQWRSGGEQQEPRMASRGRARHFATSVPFSRKLSQGAASFELVTLLRVN